MTDERGDMSLPQHDRPSHLWHEIIMLIDADNARKRTRNMIEKALDGRKRDPLRRKAGGKGPAQIVQRPLRDTARLVQARLQPLIVLEGARLVGAARRQGKPGHHFRRHRTQRKGMLSPVLRQPRRQRHHLFANHVPREAGDFSCALARQDEKLDPLAEEIVFRRLPDPLEFIVGKNARARTISVAAGGPTFLSSSRVTAILEAYRRRKEPLFGWSDGSLLRRTRGGHLPLRIARALRRRFLAPSGPVLHGDGRWTYSYRCDIQTVQSLNRAFGPIVEAPMHGSQETDLIARFVAARRCGRRPSWYAVNSSAEAK